MIGELFDNYGVTEVYASVDGRNFRSCALLAELQFERVNDAKDAVARLDDNELLFRLRVT